MTIGKIGPFDLEKDNWEAYVDRLEQYFVANQVKTEIQVATLITVIGSEAYELMINLCTPDKPAKKTYNELVALMKKHLNPKPSQLAERFKFRQRIQHKEESVSGYVAELKRLSKNCGFRDLAENLRDQFICGLSNEDIRQKLFTEDDNITFDRAFTIAMSMEAAETNAALVEGCTRGRSTGDSIPNVDTTVNFMGRSKKGKNKSERYITQAPRVLPAGGGPSGISGASSGKFRASTSRKDAINSEQKCKVCGGTHDENTCKFKMYVCRVCNKGGHLKKMCPRLREGTSLHNIHEDNRGIDNQDSESDEVSYHNNYSITTKNPQSQLLGPYTISVYVESCLLNMEIDTGSAISCISYDCYRNLFVHCKLKPSNLGLRYYTGETVTPVGMIEVKVQFKTITKVLDLYVIKSGKVNLLGRCWLNELGIPIPTCNVHKLNNLSNVFDVREFSSRYSEVFKDGLGRFTGGQVGFRLREGARPTFMRARPLAYALREPVERALDQMVRDGIITPVSTSDWATPIVPVMKKDGTIRVCADFKITLNKCLEVDHYPLPKVEDLLTKLHGGEKFTKLDLSQAYAQFELDESKKYTVINTHKGLFMYNRLIYGLASSPGIFQRKLEQLFADMPRVGIFLDDIIVTGVDTITHLKTLHEVFERLRRYGLRIKKEKCTFFADTVTYLGFVISKQGVHTCPEKVEAIKKAPTPTNIMELRSFLGLVMYYAKFVPNISTILEPLYRLLKKDVRYEWNAECQQAFYKVKHLLVSSKVLAHYAAELPLVLTTDASSVGIGAVISHICPGGEERPVAYASRVLNTAERAYSQIEREALAIIYGVRKFHQYLYGRNFILRTDHKPLVTIFGDKTGIPVMAASRMQRWAIILAGYDYTIEYVRSQRNAADALSRLPVGKEKKLNKECTYLNFIQHFLPITRENVRESTCKDNILTKVINFIRTGWPKDCKENDLKAYFIRRNELYLDRGCVVWGYRLVVPSKLRETVLRELHVSHLGIVKMKSLARSIVWWPGIDHDIETTCQECVTCGLEGTAPPKAPPKPWPYVTEPWSRLHVDFLGPFQSKTFLVIIDSTSKWLEVFLMPRTTASAVVKVLRTTFARFGLPKEIVSDNGPPFSSREYQEFMSNNGIKVTFTPVYHPASNGAAENAVKLCKRAIKKSIRDGIDLDEALQTYLMMYRNVEHSSTGESPAMLLQRRKLRTRLELLGEDRQVETRINKAQNRQVYHAGGSDRYFQVGDPVWARNYAGEKWLDGTITDRVGSRNYVVGKEGGPFLKRHVDQIKKRRSSYGVGEINSLPEPRSAVENSESEMVRDIGPEEQDLGTNLPESSAQESGPGEGIGTNPQLEVRVGNAGDNAPVNRPKRVIKPVRRYGFEDIDFICNRL